MIMRRNRIILLLNDDLCRVDDVCIVLFYD